ncbi:hypothetical protein [Clostridium sp. DL1XJH146]
MEFSGTAIAHIPIVAAINMIFRRIGIPQKFLPLLSLFIGILYGIIALGTEDIRKGILEGIIIGLGASGLYNDGVEVTKKLKNKIDDTKKE